jgi:XTP/dITP diphosphohydrolase
VRVVLATANPGKQREFSALLAPLGLELVLQTDLAVPSAEETGASFAANALLKASHAAACTGLPALADDSGLRVDALGGRPGIHSARYAGERASDADNNARLLADLAGVPDERRGAHYCCVLALVSGPDDPAPLFAHGEWHGRIGHAPAGSGGFGYDPYFIPQGFTQTVAQLAAEEKNRLSHRGLALRALAERLRHALQPGTAAWR